MTEGRTRTRLSSPRYVVTELCGYNSVHRGGNVTPGVSYHVIDTLWNRRMVASFRSEDYRGIYDGRVVARQRAYYRAQVLNDAALDG